MIRDKNDKMFNNEKLNKIFNQKASYLERVMPVICNFIDAANSAGALELVWLADLGLFALLGEYDLWVYQCSLIASKKQYVQTLYARHICLGIVEVADKLAEKTGRRYREFFVKLNDEDFLQRSVDIHKKLMRFKTDNEKQLRLIRNTVIAHKDKVTANQINVMKDMDAMDLANKNQEFLNRVEELHKLINDIIIYADRNNILNDVRFK